MSMTRGWPTLPRMNAHRLVIIAAALTAAVVVLAAAALAAEARALRGRGIAGILRAN